MGSFIEINDTLQLTKQQGFPKELDILTHLKKPFKTSDFADKIFEFKDKQNIRVYKIPPVRNFLVENIDGKWLYWGLCHIVEIKHDYINKTTSGKFKIIHINNLSQMKTAFDIISVAGQDKNNYFEGDTK